MGRTIQVRISQSDIRIIQWLERLDQEGKGIRGYNSQKIRDALNAFLILSELTGEEDPYKMMAKLLQQQQVIISSPLQNQDSQNQEDLQKHESQETFIEEENEPEPEITEAHKEKWGSILMSFDNM